MLVSVVMPAWRAETTIRDAVQSLIDQSLKDWELVIAADDGEVRPALIANCQVRSRRSRPNMAPP